MSGIKWFDMDGPDLIDRAQTLESERDSLKRSNELLVEEIKRLEKHECGECLVLKQEILTVREVSGNRLDLWSKSEKEVERLKAELDDKGECLGRAVDHKISSVIDRDAWKARAVKLEEAVKRSVLWMEPIMDGFGVGDSQKDGEPSARIVTLKYAKEVLAEYAKATEKVV